MTITLVGIPRDLYYKGRRINTVHFRNGIDAFIYLYYYLLFTDGAKILANVIHFTFFAWFITDR